jgi:CBS domain-containing protein
VTGQLPDYLRALVDRHERGRFEQGASIWPIALTATRCRGSIIAMTTVADIMSADLIHVEPTDTVATAVAIMAAAQVGSALILEGDRIVGIFTERDVLTALKTDAHRVLDSPVGDWMTRGPQAIGPETSVTEATLLMLKGGFRHLPVVSGTEPVGIVSLRDLAKALVAA